MAERYMTSDGDMIDKICWDHYGERKFKGSVAAVYEVNRWLSSYRDKLPGGLVIVLPDLPEPQAAPTIRIWGQG